MQNDARKHLTHAARPAAGAGKWGFPAGYPPPLAPCHAAPVTQHEAE